MLYKYFGLPTLCTGGGTGAESGFSKEQRLNRVIELEANASEHEREV
jgi:hypothetical protein